MGPRQPVPSNLSLNVLFKVETISRTKLGSSKPCKSFEQVQCPFLCLLPCIFKRPNDLPPYPRYFSYFSPHTRTLSRCTTSSGCLRSSPNPSPSPLPSSTPSFPPSPPATISGTSPSSSRHLSLGPYISRSPHILYDVFFDTWLSSEDVVLNGTMTTPTC